MILSSANEFAKDGASLSRLTGQLVDQAALFGVLDHLYGLGFPLLSVVADLLVYDGTSHGDYIAVMDSPESLHAFAELNAFMLRHLQ